MKKLLINFILVLGLVTPSQTLLANSKENIIQVATFAIVSPISFMGIQQPEGFDLDLIKAVAEKSHMNINITSYPFYAMAEGLNSGEIDLIISGVFYTPERDRIFELSKPYNSARDAILYINPDLKINNDEDVKDLKIAALEYSVQAKDLVNIIGVPPENIVPVKTAYLGYRAMMTGKVDAVATYDLVLHDLVKNKKGNYKFYTLKGIGKREMVALAKKGERDIIAMFNYSLKELKKDGTYDQIYKKWFKNKI